MIRRGVAEVAIGAGAGAIISAGIAVALLARGSRSAPSSTSARTDPAAVAEIVSVGREGDGGGGAASGGPAGDRTRPPAPAWSASKLRGLIAENLALRAESERLQQELAAPVVPVVQGLPVAPAQVATVEEQKLMDEIHERLAAEARPAQARLYTELTGEAPAADLSHEQIASALLELSGITEFAALNAEMTAAKALRKQNAAPPPGAPLARRVLWLLGETGDAMERELEGALPPDRLAALHEDARRGFGFSITMTNSRWLVEVSRPGP